MRHKDGSIVWILDRGKVSSWTEDGEPLMMFGTHMNITAKKIAGRIGFNCKSKTYECK
jgi:hypothetical protein